MNKDDFSKGIGNEESEKQNNTSGIYRHTESGIEAMVEGDNLSGHAQADAYVRVGFVKIAELPTAEHRIPQMEAPKVAGPEETPVQKVDKPTIDPGLSNKPLQLQNRDQLEARAKSLGLENLDQYQSNKLLVAAIKEAQQKEGK